MHHAERQRGVGAWSNRNPFVALRRRSRAQRIDRNDGSAASSRLEHEWPEMRIRGERIRTPEQHEIALRYSLRVSADVGAEGHPHPDGPSHRADRAVEHRRAEAMKESPVDR